MSSFLVTGVGGPAGRNVANLLLERNQTVIGTDIQALQPEGIKFYQVPPAGSQELLPTVYSIAIKEKVSLVIPTVSEELPVFASSWKWGAVMPVLTSAKRAIEIANDKYLTSQTLDQAGVRVPRFALPSQVHSPDDVSQLLGWPCISKPRVGRGGREVAIRYPEDWLAITGLGDAYILQEFADGTDFAPNVYIGPDGQHCVIVLEKTELKEGLVGNAKEVRRSDDPDVANLALSAAQAVGLRGPLDIDIRRRKDGLPVVLEINARFGANIRFASEVLDAALAPYLPAR
jgi:carbamoylphosphate synthase large subunit